MNQYKEADLQDLVAYIQQLESDLAKKDCIIAARDRKIAALQGSDASTIRKPAAIAMEDGRSTNCLSPCLHPRYASTPNKSVHVSDESCETESDDSFSSLGVSLLEPDSKGDELLGSFQSNGRWNIPFDDSSDDDLVPKSSMDKANPRPTTLNDICFKPIKNGGVDNDISDVADGFAAMGVTPVRPAAIPAYTLPFRHTGISPILHPVRRGLSRVDSDGSDKENIDPMCTSKKLTAETCNLSQGFSSPCR
ncbi:hypothetical protein HJC23_001758 [Cyclotella cryptica]|uniref:Uncharacterized protein n=1 Tax=Cyclotella cryptica TaxID=29204 RepID=A0ABD3QQD7_9STRA|eukprot:CCRYP_003309-RA/>CCRYP_003309-RA protein AED:0.02 eAED:0.02 QI:525/1/1/1/1/1/2/133/249